MLADASEEAIDRMTRGSGVDMVVDQVGGVARKGSLQLLRPLGWMVVMGNASGAPDIDASLSELWLTSRALLGINLQQLSAADPTRVCLTLRAALDQVVSGTGKVDVIGTLPLSEGRSGPPTHRSPRDDRQAGSSGGYEA
ncbi:zinc-binding dehydrogenase (plasmid) [Deinococcus sp. KNUC1210]|uniref:zinc-binding dehydrogenase n=1 Tax=Deinococcus sp. KNUC1210 TaxID=2917691 RepID=UPI001EF01C31|nr:zinc-binding dehydrogenase [Deinococcus sp. KNUC1210]ULH14066.1 zinc-binding dehydrogenase [Deinococcus sp. KNUC1210]